MNRPIARVCFVERHAASLFVSHGGNDEIGGAEIQQYLLAREFLARGMGASFVLGNDPRVDEGMQEGIELFKSYRADEGVRFLRFVYPRLPRLWSALDRADADLYYVRGARDIGGVVAQFCRIKRRAMFHAIASDFDCGTDLMRRHGLRAALFLHGLRRARRVLTQTEAQQRMLLANFRIDSEIVRNAMPVPELPPKAEAQPIRRVLWVGTLHPNKRPEWLLGLAARFPELEFEMIGPQRRHEMAYFQQVSARARDCCNVEHITFVPFAEIGRYFERADVLVLTSGKEGFPNVLLQAWSYGKPVISTLDPDGTIERRSMGLIARNEDDMALALASLRSDPQAAAGMGANGRRYVEEFHSPKAIVDRLLSLAQETTPDGRACAVR